MKEDLKAFFEEIKRCYKEESREMMWGWEEISLNPNAESILFYLAFNLGKYVMHGPLPQQLHNRMALETDNQFSRAYFEYLEGAS